MRRVPCTRLCTPAPDRCFCARRLVDISEMRGEERSQPLEDGTILEYIVHGKFAFKETDINDTCGAWWMPLRRMVLEVGKEVVEEKLEDFDNEIKQLRAQVIDDAFGISSSDEEGD